MIKKLYRVKVYTCQIYEIYDSNWQFEFFLPNSSGSCNKTEMSNQTTFTHTGYIYLKGLLLSVNLQQLSIENVTLENYLKIANLWCLMVSTVY